MSKWDNEIQGAIEDQANLFNRALQRGVKASLVAAMVATPTDSVDSGNAMYHWMVVTEKDRPQSRKLGTIRDLRATNTKKAKGQGIGKRRDKLKGRNAANKLNVRRAVAAREEKAIKSRVSGMRPIRRFRLYNALLEGRAAEGIDASDYRDNAGVELAVKAGVEAFKSAVDKYMAQGQVRKR
mgnify:CR=1 FL=1